jgi:hypothetical protein
MLEILQNIMAILIADATLTAIIPAANMFSGPVDVVGETQSGLLVPQLNVHIVSEVSRSVPSNTRDTVIQIDIWSRNSYIETVQVYERIIQLLNYQNPTVGTARIFWERLGSAVDQYESDRRIFHRSMSIQAWSQKP